MKTSDKIQSIADEIEQVLNSHRVATPNQFAEQRLMFLANQLSALDGTAAEKAKKIALLANSFYKLPNSKNSGQNGNNLYIDMKSQIVLIRRVAGMRAARESKEDLT